ncbi:MAG: hypothetical protein CSA70_11910 [Rhodobacterales bacterium]|nr:MAG: hypothetical protein CSA70_11910 [Rhodobacterales bacterium]
MICEDGCDTYLYTNGDGHDTIHDDGQFDTDVLQVTGINSTDVTVSRTVANPSNVLLSFAGGGSVLLENSLAGDVNDQIESITFSADSVTWDRRARPGMILFRGGMPPRHMLTGGIGNDTLIGGDQSDTYVFNAGDGVDLVQDDGYYDTDVLVFNSFASADVLALV